MSKHGMVVTLILPKHQVAGMALGKAMGLAPQCQPPDQTPSTPSLQPQPANPGLAPPAAQPGVQAPAVKPTPKRSAEAPAAPQPGPGTAQNAQPQGASEASPTTARRVISVSGMGKHVQWRFDDLGAFISKLKHSDAETAGLKVGMRLISIAGNSAAGMQKDQILQAWKNLSGRSAIL